MGVRGGFKKFSAKVEPFTHDDLCEALATSFKQSMQLAHRDS